MQTLDAALSRLVKEGVVSLEEAQLSAKGTLALKDE
jgi:twitching motility protein PilT